MGIDINKAIEEQELKNVINIFYKTYKNDKNSRYFSYDHCRKCFIENKNDPSKYDLIVLNLYAYLASWGMLRNSFLMQKDYLFNKPVVEILCKSKYSSLLNNSKDVDLIIELGNEIRDYYRDKPYWDEKGTKSAIKNATDTLITKILLGTFGCVVAYDQYVTKALRSVGICGMFNKKSILQLNQFIEDNKPLINIYTDELGGLYTPMKIIDMYFFEKGLKLVQERTKSK